MGGALSDAAWFPIPSSAALGKIGDEYTADVRRWAKGVLVHYFKKGESKEAFARPLIEARRLRPQLI